MRERHLLAGQLLWVRRPGKLRRREDQTETLSIRSERSHYVTYTIVLIAEKARNTKNRNLNIDKLVEFCVCKSHCTDQIVSSRNNTKHFDQTETKDHVNIFNQDLSMILATCFHLAPMLLNCSSSLLFSSNSSRASVRRDTASSSLEKAENCQSKS